MWESGHAGAGSEAVLCGRWKRRRGCPYGACVSSKASWRPPAALHIDSPRSRNARCVWCRRKHDLRTASPMQIWHIRDVWAWRCSRTSPPCRCGVPAIVLARALIRLGVGNAADADAPCGGLSSAVLAVPLLLVRFHNFKRAGSAGPRAALRDCGPSNCSKRKPGATSTSSR